jgi:heat shock protein HspQ
MKIIDLLNKIANGEEIPKKIRIQGEYIFELSKDFEHYYYNENLEITDLLNHNFSNLNDEVEIIEEDKKIEKLYHCCMESDNSQISILVANINMLSDKINELIDKVSKGE